MRQFLAALVLLTAPAAAAAATLTVPTKTSSARPTCTSALQGATWTTTSATGVPTSVQVCSCANAAADCAWTGTPVIDVRQYGAFCDFGVHNDTVAINAALAAAPLFGGTNIFIPPGACYVSTLNVVNDNTRIFGTGYGSAIVMADFVFGCTLDAGSHPVTLEGFRMWGHSTTPQQGIAAAAYNRNGICVRAESKSVIRGMNIEGFENTGLLFNDVVASRAPNIVISETNFLNNWTAIGGNPNAEYIRIRDVYVSASRIAIDVQAGNVAIGDTWLVDNGYGLKLTGVTVDGGVSSNNGHGSFVGGGINHSGVCSVCCNNITIGYNVTGAEINQGNIVLDTCTGININSGAFDVAQVRLSGGGRSYLRDNFVYNAYAQADAGVPIILHNYLGSADNTVLEGNYLASGAAVGP